MNQNHALQHPSFHWTSFTETFLLFSGRPPDLHWKAKKLDRRFGTHRTDRQGLQETGIDRLGLQRCRLDRLGLQRCRLDRLGLQRCGLDRLGLQCCRLDRLGIRPHVRIDRLGLRQTDYIGQDLEVEGSTHEKKCILCARGRPRQPQIEHPRAQKCILYLFKSFQISKKQKYVKNDGFAPKILKSQISVFFCAFLCFSVISCDFLGVAGHAFCLQVSSVYQSVGLGDTSLVVLFLWAAGHVA